MTRKKIKEIFKLNPELEQIGTEREYQKYLETIFPESKVRDILYHGGVSGIKTFDPNAQSLDNREGRSRGRFFTSILNLAKNYAEKAKMILKKDSHVYRVILDVRNPALVNSSDGLDEKLHPQNDSIIYDSFLEIENEEVVVFEPSQIHILGSESDIEKFKEFISKNETQNIHG